MKNSAFLLTKKSPSPVWMFNHAARDTIMQNLHLICFKGKPSCSGQTVIHPFASIFCQNITLVPSLFRDSITEFSVRMARHFSPYYQHLFTVHYTLLLLIAATLHWDAASWVRDAWCWMLNVGSWMLDAGCFPIIYRSLWGHMRNGLLVRRIDTFYTMATESTRG